MILSKIKIFLPYLFKSGDERVITTAISASVFSQTLSPSFCRSSNAVVPALCKLGARLS
jgi:hypothetical protein